MSLERFYNKLQLIQSRTRNLAQSLEDSDLNSISYDSGILENVPNDLLDVEGHIYDLDGKYITSQYGLSYEYSNTYKDFLIDIPKIFDNSKLFSGSYKISFSFLINILGNINQIPFFVHEISDDRTELKLRVKLSYASLYPNILKELQDFKNIISNLKSSGRLNNVALNFGSNNIFQVVNLKVECIDRGANNPCQTEGENNCNELVVFVKLQYPLLNFIQEKQFCFVSFKVLEDYVDTFIVKPQEQDNLFKQLKGPRFEACSNIETSNSTELKSWNNLLDSSVTTSNSLIREILSGSEQIPLNLDYTDFKNFVVYGSALERVRNYNYKRQLIEYYDSQKQAVTRSNASGSIYVTNLTDTYTQRSSAVLAGFDDFEKYLYSGKDALFSYDISGSISPSPKFTRDHQIYNYHTTSSEYVDWYDNLEEIAAQHDFRNYDSFYYNTPDHILRDSNNSQYITFLYMVGQHFDNLYNYINALTQIHRRDEHPSRGIPNKLLPYYARSLGWKIQNTKQLSDLWLYKLGTDQNGDYLNVSGSLVSLAHENLNHQIWRRIVNNLPFLLKTKGSERSIRALFSVYGIPFSLISIKEYGGPKKEEFDSSGYANLTQDRFQYALTLKGDQYIELPRALVSASLNASTEIPQTVEFRFKTAYTASNSMSLWAIEEFQNRTNVLHNLELVKSSESFYGVSTYGYLKYTLQQGSPSSLTSVTQTGSLLPYFDGDFWSVRIYADAPIYSGSIFDNSLHIESCKVSDFTDARISHSSSFTISGSSLLYSLGAYKSSSFDNHYITLGGTTGSYSNRFSGSIQAYKEYFTTYPQSTFFEHALNPASYHTDTYSGSYHYLYRYFPLGLDNLKHDHYTYLHVSSSQPNRNFYFGTTSSFFNFSGSDREQYESSAETYFQYLPTLGANPPRSNKIRIESSTLGGPLSPEKRSEISTFDKSWRDSNRLAIVFSPTDQLNRDIANQFGPVDFDSFIGDPQDGVKDTYPSLTNLRQEYFKKFNKANDLGKYIEIFSLYDYTVFSQLKQLIPARANLISGILVEPSILERPKIRRTFPSINVLNLESNLETRLTTLSSSYIPPHETELSPLPLVYASREKEESNIPVIMLAEGELEKNSTSTSISYDLEIELEKNSTRSSIGFDLEIELEKNNLTLQNPLSLSMSREKYNSLIFIDPLVSLTREKQEAHILHDIDLSMSRERYSTTVKIPSLSISDPSKVNVSMYSATLNSSAGKVSSQVIGTQIISKSTSYSYVQNGVKKIKTIQETNLEPYRKVITPLQSIDRSSIKAEANVVGSFTVEQTSGGGPVPFSKDYLNSELYIFTLKDYSSGINLNTQLTGVEFYEYILKYNYLVYELDNRVYKNKPQYNIDTHHISSSRVYSTIKKYDYFYSSSGEFVLGLTSPNMLLSPVYLNNRTGSKDSRTREVDFAINREYNAYYSSSLRPVNYQFFEDSNILNCRFKGSKLQGPDINVDSTSTLFGTPVVIVNLVEENPIRI